MDPSDRNIEDSESLPVSSIDNQEGASASVATVIASQTWTRKLKCIDPECVLDHEGGGKHEWDLKEESPGMVDNPKDEYKAPAERIVTPLDVLDCAPTLGETMIYIVGTRGTKVTRIAGLEYLSDCLEELVLRSNLIATMEGVQSLSRLTKLELYDNQLEDITHLESLSRLVILDMSYNSIRSMASVASCPLLEELYLAQNKLKAIEGIRGMKHLRCLDLGANRIRSMAGAGLNTLTGLQSLWLGKNKLERIEDINQLPHLKQLDIQNNRLTTLLPGDAVDETLGISSLTSLQELYLACNAISNVLGLPTGSPLSTLDLSTNAIDTLEGIEEHKFLTELWMTASKLSNFDQLAPLKMLPELECLYLEHSPLASDFEYRIKITSMLPSLQQLDATAVSRY
jgi:protein phosphatase 1 regulatory subunit 7